MTVLEKGLKFAKFSLFDALPMNILSIINNSVLSFEYNDKRIAVVNRIIQENPVLRKLSYTKLKPFHNFGPLSF